METPRHFGILLLPVVTLIAKFQFAVSESFIDCHDKVGVPCTISEVDDCTSNGMTECSPGSQALKPTKAPSCNIQKFESNGTVGFNISFSLPDDSGRLNLEGYWIRVTQLSSLNTKCYCVKISKVHCIDKTNIMLQMESIGWNCNFKYNFIIQSLPASETNYLQLMHSVGECLGTNDSCSWKLTDYTLEIIPNSESHGWNVVIKFTFPPYEWGFKEYRFDMMANGFPNDCTFRENPINTSVLIGDKDIEQGNVSLKTNLTGIHCIRLIITCGENKCPGCDKELQRTTFRITINGTTTTSRVSRSVKDLYHRTYVRNLSSQESCKAKPNLVAIVVPLVGILTIGVIVLVILKKRRPKRMVLHSNLEVPVSPNGLPNPVYRPNHSSPPSVLLVYSNDFKEHQEVILKLAKFLSKCQMSIMFNLWEEMASNDNFLWMLDSVEKADKVLIVHSQGTYTRYDCHKCHLYIKDEKPSPHPDLFDGFVKHFMSKYLLRYDWHSLGKFVNARFDYCDTKYVIDDFLGNASVFVLMQHMKDLVAKLHGTTCYSDNFPWHSIDWENYSKYDSGHEMKIALDAAHMYLKRNPDWFDQKYKISSTNGVLLHEHVASDAEAEDDDTSQRYDNTCHNNFVTSPSSDVYGYSEMQTIRCPVELGGASSAPVTQTEENEHHGHCKSDIYKDSNGAAMSKTLATENDIYKDFHSADLTTSLATGVNQYIDTFHEPDIVCTDKETEDEDDIEDGNEGQFTKICERIEKINNPYDN